jgi:hypothetical protein
LKAALYFDYYVPRSLTDVHDVETPIATTTFE